MSKDKDLAEYEKAHKRMEAMDALRSASDKRVTRTSGKVVSAMPVGAEGATRVLAKEQRKTEEQIEDEMVEKGSNWFHKPLPGTDARDRMNTRYEQRQEWNAMRAKKGQP